MFTKYINIIKYGFIMCLVFIITFQYIRIQQIDSKLREVESKAYSLEVNIKTIVDIQKKNNKVDNIINNLLIDSKNKELNNVQDIINNINFINSKLVSSGVYNKN